MPKSYYRIMLGRRSAFAQQCFAGGFVGIDDDAQTGDLTGKLPDDWRAFNEAFIPLFLKLYPDKSRIAAGLAGGVTWTISKGISKGAIVLSPDGQGTYWVGEVTGDYLYVPGDFFPHRRPVHWLDVRIERSAMSDALKGSTGAVGTISTITRHSEEIERLLGGASTPHIVTGDPTVEDPAAFAMEKHLEDFLVQNWAQTELGRSYDIYEEDGEKVGQQYPTDTGPLDVLAVRKDKKELLVVELKRGRASDVVVGQILRYMGYVMQELAEPGQTVRGAIIALDDDQRIRRALAASPSIEFFRYQVTFKLVRA